MRPSRTPPLNLTDELEQVQARLGGYVAVHVRGGRFIQLKMRSGSTGRIKTDGKWNGVSSKDRRKRDRKELQRATYALRLVRPKKDEKGRRHGSMVLHVWYTRRCDRVGLLRALQAIA